MRMPSEITEVKVIYDDRDPSSAGWFARAYNDTYSLPDEQLEAETAEAAVAEIRQSMRWKGRIEVYNSITCDMPSSVIPAI